MIKRPHRNQSAAFKAKLSVAAIKGEKALVELEQDFDVYPNQIKQWRGQSLEAAPESVIDVKTLNDGRERRDYTTSM